jgi:predicted P-loop ATPase/GTPase
LNLDVGKTSENIETLENIWENTPSENVYGPNNWFSYSMRRRKVSP